MNDMSPIHIVPFYEAAAIKRRAIKPLMWQRNKSEGLQRDKPGRGRRRSWKQGATVETCLVALMCDYTPWQSDHKKGYIAREAGKY